jgi:late competence protein required for DNA uptake (superfamily II DNA/RNA helicase)
MIDRDAEPIGHRSPYTRKERTQHTVPLAVKSNGQFLCHKCCLGVWSGTAPQSCTIVTCTRCLVNNRIEP